MPPLLLAGDPTEDVAVAVEATLSQALAFVTFTSLTPGDAADKILGAFTDGATASADSLFTGSATDRTGAVPNEKPLPERTSTLVGTWTSAVARLLPANGFFAGGGWAFFTAGTCAGRCLTTSI